MAAAAEALGAPAVFGLTLDIGHCRCLEPDPVPTCVTAVADHLVNVQIDDMRRGVHEHLEFGEGRSTSRRCCARSATPGTAGWSRSSCPATPTPPLRGRPLDRLPARGRKGDRRQDVNRRRRAPPGERPQPTRRPTPRGKPWSAEGHGQDRSHGREATTAERETVDVSGIADERETMEGRRP
ncbi:hypothetical protein ACFQX6_03820 [Streptosporangium lutulentum]